MAHHNFCVWISKGQTEPCNKACYKHPNLCSKHYFWSKKRTTIPKPCKKCGKAVLVDYQICNPCGGLKISYKLKCIKEATLINHKRMIQELKTVFKFSQKKIIHLEK